MKKVSRDLIYLEDVRDAIKEIESFMECGVRDLKTYRAIERNFEIIGEASARISEETKSNNPAINWREIKSLRNIIAHEYSRINSDMIWSIAGNDLETLLKNIERILETYSN
jgi:uncharacterized protein with HEPN domain